MSAATKTKDIPAIKQIKQRSNTLDAFDVAMENLRTDDRKTDDQLEEELLIKNANRENDETRGATSYETTQEVHQQPSVNFNIPKSLDVHIHTDKAGDKTPPANAAPKVTERDKCENALNSCWSLETEKRIRRYIMDYIFELSPSLRFADRLSGALNCSINELLRDRQDTYVDYVESMMKREQQFSIYINDGVKYGDHKYVLDKITDIIKALPYYNTLRLDGDANARGQHESLLSPHVLGQTNEAIVQLEHYCSMRSNPGFGIRGILTLDLENRRKAAFYQAFVSLVASRIRKFTYSNFATRYMIDERNDNAYIALVIAARELQNIFGNQYRAPNHLPKSRSLARGEILI